MGIERRDYERTLATLRAFTTVEDDVHRSSDMRILMLADLVVVAITLLITVRFFVRYRRGR
jgi:hypothetical protein